MQSNKRCEPERHLLKTQVTLSNRPRPHTPTLFTLGYEGLVIDAFIARLQAAQVKTVVDVRELPLSRKKGFSEISILLSIASHWWKKR